MSTICLSAGANASVGGVTGVADKVISGWGFNGVSTFQDGYPMEHFRPPQDMSQPVREPAPTQSERGYLAVMKQ